MTITNLKGLPLPIVAAIQNDDHISQGSDIGAATVASPVRQVALRRKHRSEITEDASERIWSLFGTAIHEVLYQAGKDQGDERRKIDDALAIVRSLPSSIEVANAERALLRMQEVYDPAPQPFQTFIEERWEMEVLGWKVAARCDHVTLDGDGTLTDYKVSSVWSVKDGEAKPEWVAQLNVTRLCGKVAAGIDPRKLQATVFLRDWRKNERLRYGEEYPELQVATVPVPLWSDEECMRYLTERVALHQAARLTAMLGGTLDECTPEERWAKPTTYAVCKKTNKNATRVYDTRAKADIHAAEQPDLEVRVRPGESTRCAQYCEVLPFCDQGQRILAALKAGQT